VDIEQAPNFRRMSELVTTSGLVTEDQLRGLADEGYDVVVNLLPDESERALRDESRIVEASGLDYVHIPVDFSAPTSDDLERFFRAMDANAGRTVHIHCAANYRVSAFYALYLRHEGLCSAAEAEALVRDVWDTSTHPAWEALLDAELGPDRPT
jgi:uncharacterized protein (TIGR01244 family)